MKSFTIYREYHELITLLPEKEQEELYLAIAKFMFEDIEPSLNDRQTKIFNNLKRPLEKSKIKSKQGSIITSNENRNEIETKSNENRNKIEIKSKDETKQNRNKIETKSHQDVIVIVNKEDNIINKNINNNSYLEEEKKEQKKEEENPNSNYYTFLEEQFGRTISSTETEVLDYLLETYDKDLVKEAIKQSVIMTRKNLNYVKGILKNWKSDEINTLDDLKKKENENEREEEPSEEFFHYNWLEDEEHE